MTARIDAPLIGVDVPAKKTTYIAGVAFSGNKGISEVDVSLDAGKTWQRATLKRPLSDLTWVLWEYLWQPTTRGTYTLVVRAIDMEGNVQDPRQAPPAPDGSSGYDGFDISVVLLLRATKLLANAPRKTCHLACFSGIVEEGGRS